MKVAFREHLGDALAFISILPNDWAAGLLEIWEEYAPKSTIYVLVQGERIVAGGIVVNGVPDDMYHFLEEARFWADKGYSYIGYLWVVEDQRNKNLGSRWLDELKNRHPKAKFWLSIEDESLKAFYSKNHFRLANTLNNGTELEWVLCYDGAKE